VTLEGELKYGHIELMATPKIKATYSLDVQTIRAVERAARRWKISKSEVLRRAVQAIAGKGTTARDALATLDALQDAAKLMPTAAERWQTAVRHERAARDNRMRSK
jgi:hypothetical protein